MNRSLADCWQALRQMDPSLLQHRLRPLDHLEACVEHFGLAPLPLEKGPLEGVEIPSTSPSFRGVNDDVLLFLRLQTYARGVTPFVEAWAEKLLRFCELRRRNLEARTLAKFQDRAVARVHILHLGVFFLDFAEASQDCRFLNTALKLADLRWLAHGGKPLEEALRTAGPGDATPLLRFRMLVTSEWLVDRLRREGTG